MGALETEEAKAELGALEAMACGLCGRGLVPRLQPEAFYPPPPPPPPKKKKIHKAANGVSPPGLSSGTGSPSGLG